MAIFFFGGLNLLALGIVGQYIARIYREIKGCPLYIVEAILTSDQPVSAEKPQRGSGDVHPASPV
jgi:dolichol-phosphate mannosyltransferase